LENPLALIDNEDQHYFSKVFKIIAGVTPSEFKDNLKLS
jgi:YesN/AraC family two-component response regulator